MNIAGKLLLLIVFPILSHAQDNPYWQEPSSIQADSLKKVLTKETNDSVSMHINRLLGLYYQEINRPIALNYFEEMLNLARKSKQRVWEAEAISRVGYVNSSTQNYSRALKILLEAESLASKEGLENGMWSPRLLSHKNQAYHARMMVYGDVMNHLGILHYFTGQYERGLNYHRRVQQLNSILEDDAMMSLSCLNMGECYMGLSQLDSAELLFKRSISYSDKSGHRKYKGLTLFDLGQVYKMRKNIAVAKNYYRLSILSNIESESPDFEGMGYQVLADISNSEGDIDSLFYFSHQALKIYKTINDTLGLISAYTSLSKAFDARKQDDSAYQYLKTAITLKDGLNKEERIKSFQLAAFNEQLKLEEQKAEQLRTITRIRTYSFIAGIAVLLILSVMFYSNYRRQRKDRTKIEHAFAELKATQNLLIQSEKMASLGELTAGIAHEIQNPLNFVNNFSELNKEMVDEANVEMAKGNIDEVNNILKDIKSNSEKIHHHGKRADNIVKGMLQHSQSSKGPKEPTDINVLADEYVRLAYHGLRAKDKSFNAALKIDYDENIGTINIVPQDIGRVILNLVTNSFYAVSEKKKSGMEVYEPTVTVRTKKVGGLVEISVEDNGNGIRGEIIGKIFQPFFTTKPTGQGTGLGLSLSYDIVKAHGGELSVNTKEGEGTEFIIRLISR